TVGIEHGRRPRGGSYAYAAIPGVACPTRPDPVAHPWQILANCPEVQAVTDTTSGATAASFFDRATLQLSDGLGIEVDRPAVMLVEPRNEATVRVTLADPLQQG